ncbi:hypothetical protein AAAT91_16830 [Bacteroides uniformis]|uniref:hypothetical protein n=1 Tax=Bacteroides uniformis TaxID=820 RepID=UPI0032BF381E
MKDQKELLKKCLVNDIPAIVFQGSDSCAVEILQAAENIYRKNGCSPEFLIDFHENVVENFRAYQLENSIATKLPDLTTSEKEAFYILQEKEEAYFPIQIKDFEQHLKDYGFTRTYENTTSYGKYLLLKEKDYIGITGNNGNYDFAINYSKESNQISYFVFSDDPNYPERIGDYNSLKTCFSDIMSRHPLKDEKNELFTVIENYHQMGYDDISQALTQYASAIDNFCNNAQSKYIIEGISQIKTDSRQLIGNITITKRGNIPVSQITDFRIKDIATGKIEPLTASNIDLGAQTPEAIKRLLSGHKVEMTDKSGNTNLVSLNKTVTGWGITAVKQVFNSADTSAEI